MIRHQESIHIELGNSWVHNLKENLVDVLEYQSRTSDSRLSIKNLIGFLSLPIDLKCRTLN